MDLLSLRDIDAPSISPNGKHIVFQVHQARAATNDYTNVWEIIDLTTRHTKVLVAHGGDPILSHSGEWQTYAPVWSADSRSFLYVRKDAERMTLHRMTLTGSDTVIRLPYGTIMDLRPDGLHDAYVSVDGPNARTEEEMRVRQRDGLLLQLEDVSLAAQGTKINQFAPWKGPSGLSPQTVTSGFDVNVQSGQVRAQPISPGAVFVPDALTRSIPLFEYALFATVSPLTATTAFIAKVASTDAPGDRNAIYIIPPHARSAMPITPLDERPIRAISWAPGGESLYYLQATDYTGENLFAIDPVTKQSRALTHTSGYLDRCSFARIGTLAACTIESTSTPAELALVNLQSGNVETLTGVNAGFNQLEKARTETLTWINKDGDRMWGVLTYPLGYRSGVRYPLVITLYRARTFLRGAVGDEYPVSVFAANGFMVLSADIYNITHAPNAPGEPKPFSDLLLHWQSPLDGLEQMIGTLSDRALIDKQRVGISGLSEGTEIVDYAISHSHVFAAAISDGGSARDPFSYYLKSETMNRLLKAWGLDGSPYGPNALKWQALSPALNAGSITTPLLMNAPDSEYEDALQQYWEMHDHGKPIEMWIFQDEGHVKHQPMHRLVLYNRNLDWFRFWLQGYEDSNPAKAVQYKRWAAMRN